jgi:uncharacterized membrane protein (DUF4010 family)
MELSVGLKILISLVIGAALGLEREVHERHEDENKKDPHEAGIAFIGVRTLSLTTALGAISGLLYTDYFGLFLTITITFMALILIHYAISSLLTKDIGVTTEIATIYSYLIGLFIALEVFPIMLTFAITILLMLILANKEKVKTVVQDVHARELKAVIGYGLIALVILPFLPNTGFTIGDIPFLADIVRMSGIDYSSWKDIEIINPFKMWMIVAIITGVDLAGYWLQKAVGKDRGLLLTSLVGGFVSSTATTQSIALQSKKTKNINPLVAAALFATFSSFFSVAIVLFSLNPEFTFRLLPTLLLLIVSFAVIGLLFLKKNNHRSNENTEQKSDEKEGAIFSIRPALIFAVLYIGVKFLSNTALVLFGQTGFLVTASLAAFTGIDAISITIAELSPTTISVFTGVLAFILVNAMNLFAKTFYIFLQGNRELAWKYGLSIFVIIAVSFAGLLFV